VNNSIGALTSAGASGYLSTSISTSGEFSPESAEPTEDVLSHHQPRILSPAEGQVEHLCFTEAERGHAPEEEEVLDACFGDTDHNCDRQGETTPPPAFLPAVAPPPVRSPMASYAYPLLQFMISTLGLILHVVAPAFGTFVTYKWAAATGGHIEAQLIAVDLAPLFQAHQLSQLQQPIGSQPSLASNDPQSGEASNDRDLEMITRCIKKLVTEFLFV
jgi:hypothetical protein